MKSRKILFAIVLLVLMSTLSFAKDTDQARENHQRITKRIAYLLQDQWGVDQAKVSGESLLKSDFGADYLDVMELIMALEEDFHIEITDEEWINITTVDSAAELIAYKMDHRYRRP
ncbi:MAG: phosphopantetheine-binding protein [Pedobacter sp.]